MERFFGLVGVFFPLACAYLMSSNRRSINWRPVFWGIGLQVTFAICILYGRVGNFSFGEVFFRLFDDFFTKLLAYSDKGADFIFASFQSLINKLTPFPASVVNTLKKVVDLLLSLFLLCFQ